MERLPITSSLLRAFSLGERMEVTLMIADIP